MIKSINSLFFPSTPRPLSAEENKQISHLANLDPALDQLRSANDQCEKIFNRNVLISLAGSSTAFTASLFYKQKILALTSIAFGILFPILCNDTRPIKKAQNRLQDELVKILELAESSPKMTEFTKEQLSKKMTVHAKLCQIEMEKFEAFSKGRANKTQKEIDEYIEALSEYIRKTNQEMKSILLCTDILNFFTKNP